MENCPQYLLKNLFWAAFNLVQHTPLKLLLTRYWLDTSQVGNEASKDKLKNKKEFLFHY